MNAHLQRGLYYLCSRSTKTAVRKQPGVKEKSVLTEALGVFTHGSRSSYNHDSRLLWNFAFCSSISSSEISGLKLQLHR